MPTRARDLHALAPLAKPGSPPSPSEAVGGASRGRVIRAGRRSGREQDVRLAPLEDSATAAQAVEHLHAPARRS
jgi:hypothetical protein